MLIDFYFVMYLRLLVLSAKKKEKLGLISSSIKFKQKIWDLNAFIDLQSCHWTGSATFLSHLSLLPLSCMEVKQNILMPTLCPHSSSLHLKHFPLCLIKFQWEPFLKICSKTPSRSSFRPVYIFCCGLCKHVSQPHVWVFWPHLRIHSLLLMLVTNPFSCPEELLLCHL